MLHIASFLFFSFTRFSIWIISEFINFIICIDMHIRYCNVRKLTFLKWMLLNQIKQVNLKCSPKQCGVLEITNKLCANKLGEHSSLWTSILHRNHCKFTNAVTIVSFKFAVYQNDEIISTAMHVKKKDACCSSYINN